MAEQHWILVPQESGTLGPGASSPFVIRVDRDGLEEGEHEGTVRIDYANGQVSLKVIAVKRRIAELDMTFEDGSIEDGIFQSSKEIFAVGEGGPFRHQDLVHAIILSNHGPGVLDQTEVRLSYGNGGLLEFEAIRPGLPTRGSVAGFSDAGFTWQVGRLLPDESVEIQFYSEALASGYGVAKAEVFASGSALVSLSEPIAIERSRSLGFSLEDGRIDTGGVFHSGTSFLVGDGGSGREQELYYQMILTNNGTTAITGTRLDASLHNGILEFREIRSGFPTKGSIQSLTLEGFAWSIGTLNPGESVELQVRVEALKTGYGRFLAKIDSDQASGLETGELTGVSN